MQESEQGLPKIPDGLDPALRLIGGASANEIHICMTSHYFEWREGHPEADGQLWQANLSCSKNIITAGAPAIDPC